jgi:hypothetical protein
MKEGDRIDPQTRCDFAMYHAQVVAVLCQAIFNRLGCKVPAANRWYTFPVALCTQALGLMCHGILHKVVAASSLGIFKEELAADMDYPNQSYKQYCAGKERQATDFLTDFPENVILLANAVVTSEPLDKLSNRLQHLDTCGRAWQEVIGPQGLIAECQRRLCSLGQPWGEEEVSWQLPMLLHHFPDYKDRVVEDMLRVTTSLGANVWARLK